MNLREARDKGEVNKFIAEREAENAAPGDKAAFKRVLRSMARKSKATQATSKPERSGD